MKRLLSIDIMRGLTIVFMIIVNNLGGPDNYLHLEHSEWNGITMCDLVFPFFLFIMGMSTYISLSKRDFKSSKSTIIKIVRRAVVIILIGWAIKWFANICKGYDVFDFSHFRLTGVLPRIGICYGIVALLAVYVNRKAMAWIAAALLIIYGGMLLMFNGYENDSTNINAIIDQALLGKEHLYWTPVDPEGLLGTIPSVAHTIIGFCCGTIILKKESLDSRLVQLFVVGAILSILGFIFSGILEPNKRIWSSSYVLTTCGLAAILLATISYFTDIKHYGKWFTFFEAYGVNPLFMYVLGSLFGVILGTSGATDAIYDWALTWLPNPKFASMLFSVALALFTYLFAYPLYRKRIYIKI